MATKLLLILFSLIISAAVSIWVMMYGWGLGSPKSWGVVISGVFIQWVLSIVVAATTTTAERKQGKV